MTAREHAPSSMCILFGKLTNEIRLLILRSPHEGAGTGLSTGGARGMCRGSSGSFRCRDLRVDASSDPAVERDLMETR